MPIPGTIATRSIHTNIADFDGASAEGTVTFTNHNSLYDESGNVILAPGAYSAALVDGEATVIVPTTDAAGVTPIDRTLQVDLVLSSGWASRYFIEVPTGVGTLELSDLPPLLTAGTAAPAALAMILEEANAYTDSVVALKTALAGDTMTGLLTLSANPVAALGASTKQYSDSGDALKVNKAGDTMTGPLILNGAPTASTGAATKQYTDAADATKVNKAGDTMTGPLIVIHNGYSADVARDLSIASSTGIAYTNGPITQASSTSINIPAGVAVFSHHDFDEQSFSVVEYGPFSSVVITDLTDPVTYFMIDEAGAVIQNAGLPTRAQRRDFAILGRAVVLSSAIISVQDSPMLSKHPHSFTHDMLSAIGDIRVEGIRATAIASSMTFSLTAGSIFNPGANYQFDEKDPNVSPFNAVSPTAFRYVTQSGVVDVTPRTVIDPTIYDVGGVVTTIGGGSGTTTIQRVHCFPTQSVYIQLGQNTYSTLANALDALSLGETLPFITHPDLRGGGVRTAFIIAQRTTTNLADTTVARVARATRFGDPGGI